MLRSRRATPIQDIVDGATTENRADRRQDHRLRIGATEHLNGKSRTRGERDRELGAVVGRGAGVEQKPCVGSLTRLDTLDDLGPFALQLSGILDRGRLGSTGGGSSSGHSTRYTLHYESNGGTAYKDERCSSGTKVTLDKTPTRESYTFTGWYADKALTQKITSVTMNSDKTVYAGWEATGVPDKLNGDDHFAYVIGYPDGKVHPEGNISRAETATIFFRLLKSDIRDGNLTADNEFSDVSDGQWHNKAVSTMAKLGIVKGRRADRFDPDASITRAEFAAICLSLIMFGRYQKKYGY